MGVVEELETARATYERGDWATAFRAWTRIGTERLDEPDLDRLASTAYLLDEFDTCVAALQRAYALYVASGSTTAAARAAFWLGMVLLDDSQDAVAQGWAARGERLLDDLPDTVERGYLAVLAMQIGVATGDFGQVPELAERIVDHGRRFSDPDLVALGTSALGRLRMLTGDVPGGLRLLDEAMVGVLAGELSPVFAGMAYCLMIEGCQEVSDLDRAARWTEALSRWCAEQPGLVAYTGQCALHRGQLLRLRGALGPATEELERAVERYRASRNPAPAGLALAERGDVLLLRGELDAALDSYRQAQSAGYDPQPGPALAWTALGREAEAVAAVERLLAEPRPAPARARLLPGAIEVLLSAGRDVDALVAELDGLAAAFGCDGVGATAALAHGRAQLAGGDPAGALPYLRKAAGAWRRIDAPVEVARTLLVLGHALDELGDHESARGEYAAAEDLLRGTGARALLDEATGLLAPGEAPAGLTAREVEVLRLVAAGMSNAGIAAELVLSEKTVARHLSNIFTKLGVGSRTAAAAFAFEHGLARH